jgi:DNA-binding response OmpR family regulator
MTAGPQALNTSPSGVTILLVEDDSAISNTMTDMLESEGYVARRAKTAAEARAAVDSEIPGLIILDLMLPDADGLVLCADLKARTNSPIIICSATVRKRDAVIGLKLGADDFIAKPFDVDEFLTRVAAVLRRHQMAGAAPATMPAPQMIGATTSQAAGPPRASAPAPSTPTNGFMGVGASTASAPTDGPAAVSVGPLSLEHSRRRVTFGGEELSLTPTEYRLLATFLSRPDEVLSRQDLAQIVWGYEDASIGRSIDVHVHRLRQKLQRAEEAVGRAGPTVVSVRGFGYKLLNDVSEAASASAA